MGTNANTQSNPGLTADEKAISRDASGIALSFNMLGSDRGANTGAVSAKKMIISGQNASSIQLGTNSFGDQRLMNHTFDTKSQANYQLVKDDELQRAYADINNQRLLSRQTRGVM